MALKNIRYKPEKSTLFIYVNILIHIKCKINLFSEYTAFELIILKKCHNSF